ncbi:DNA cytosine methyltransferase [Arthrobacter sp. 18067]|uniref:DNA cytosine methyltransferase n=1 Tax=Arthrobacter sp. 18067 TaxID=2681413 RepID=UPI001356873B|nr:DNA cytosine methyltransferase [Arthrobacter sp. 18067]
MSGLTVSDFFCGAGGSSTGMAQVPGLHVRLALNHWERAIQSHSHNHPDTEHACADIAHIRPEYTPRTDLLWASPECTNFTVAKGVKRDSWDGENVIPDEAAQRSRATMYDVPRFAEVHRYAAIMTENVVEVTAWKPFRGWLQSMTDLGYEHRIVSLNSMHAQAYGPGAPQSRDRVYIVFWLKGNRAPDFDRLRPYADCPSHGRVQCLQVFKKPGRLAGKYRAQYVYRCPASDCARVLEPSVRPASDAIDWSLKGVRLGDRKRPLADRTQQQIVDFVNKFGEQPGLTQYYGTPHPKPVTEPFSTFTTRDRHGLVTFRRNANVVPVDAGPFSTITAGGNHHGLVSYTRADLDDVEFRLIQPHEQMWGMDFPRDYTILGTKKERTMQAGNAVTPAAARDIAGIVADSFELAA